MQLEQVKRNKVSPVALSNMNVEVLAELAYPTEKYPDSFRDKWVGAVEFLRTGTRRGWILERELTRPVLQ